MKFKEFIKISEEQSSTDKGLMGFPVSSYLKKPSDGQPFANILGSVSGAKPRGNSGGAGASPMSGAGSPMMMRKKMKKN